MSEFTGNTASACPWCGGYHGPLLSCDQDGLRREIERLHAHMAELERELCLRQLDTNCLKFDISRLRQLLVASIWDAATAGGDDE